MTKQKAFNCSVALFCGLAVLAGIGRGMSAGSIVFICFLSASNLFIGLWERD